jgi:predicted amidohydrolase
MNKVKVGLVQMSCTKDKQENLNKAIVKVREAAAKRSPNCVFTRAFYLIILLRC